LRGRRATVNSYKRLVVGRALSGATWAPAYITYATTTARLRPHTAGRLEIRLPDSACNAYLYPRPDCGRARRYDRNSIPVRTDINCTSCRGRIGGQGHQVLPQSLHEAIDALEAGYGDSMARPRISRVNSFAERMEWTEYSRHVSIGKSALSEFFYRRAFLGPTHVWIVVFCQESCPAQSTGALMVPMLVGMTERVPIPRGSAVYTTGSKRHHNSVVQRRDAVDWSELLARIAADFAHAHEITVQGNHAVLISAADPDLLAAWLPRNAPMSPCCRGPIDRSLQGRGRTGGYRRPVPFTSLAARIWWTHPTWRRIGRDPAMHIRHCGTRLLLVHNGRVIHIWCASDWSQLGIEFETDTTPSGRAVSSSGGARRR